MYHTILIPVENRETDNTILEHIRPLARLTNAKLLLVHVADGWVARNFEQLKLQESEEMKHDREYLASLEAQLRGEGFEVSSLLAMGEPSTEIIKLANAGGVDLCNCRKGTVRGECDRDAAEGKKLAAVKHEHWSNGVVE
jgi:nucleotide-binding universal stress UspA family protein